MLETGIKAPEFTLLNQNGEEVSLSDFRGQKVVLYFYSKDNTAGCTKQACGFGELYPAFQKKGAVIIGISKDTYTSHKKFADKYELPFILLANPECDIMEAYDVRKEKTMYGKKVMGTVRTTYLIDEEGMIVRAFAKVKPADNPQQMLDEL